MKIVSVGTDAKGNINIEELKKASEMHKENLSALMVCIYDNLFNMRGSFSLPR